MHQKRTIELTNSYMAFINLRTLIEGISCIFFKFIPALDHVMSLISWGGAILSNGESSVWESLGDLPITNGGGEEGGLAGINLIINRSCNKVIHTSSDSL